MRGAARVSDYGPEERVLFETAATDLYEDIVAHGGIKRDDPRIATRSGSHRAAFEMLLDLDLVILDAPTATYVAVDPSTIQSRIVAPLGLRGAELLTESSEWAKAFGTLSHAWRRSPESARGPFTEIHGPDAIQSYIAGVVADCEEELLTAQPQTGRDPKVMAAAAQRDSAALERGITMRTLYQHSARRSAVTHKYVAAVTARGAEVRTLDEFFNRIIVVDRRVAIVPGQAGLAVALSIRESSLVAYLVDIFERTWERARPFTNRETSMMRDIAAEQRAMTIRMLIEGHADPVSAKRLGVSPRTYAGYVADLKAEYEAETRFQLGYVMGQQGVSGNERPDASGNGRPHRGD
jgi:hypothetical protein